MPKATCSVIEDGKRCEIPVYILSRGWCSKHYQRWQKHGDPLRVDLPGFLPTDPALRFWTKVDKNGPLPAHRPELGPCYFWTGAKMSGGYGSFGVENRRVVLAHRWVYEHFRGPIPDGLEIDHLCHNGSGCPGGITCPHRLCVNPEHLEAVTRRVNCLRGESPSAIHARKTHCPQGHPYVGENLYITSTGGRQCRICQSERSAQRPSTSPA
jgi:hypothetical protein